MISCSTVDASQPIIYSTLDKKGTFFIEPTYIKDTLAKNTFCDITSAWINKRSCR